MWILMHMVSEHLPGSQMKQMRPWGRGWFEGQTEGEHHMGQGLWFAGTVSSAVLPQCLPSPYLYHYTHGLLASLILKDRFKNTKEIELRHSKGSLLAVYHSQQPSAAGKAPGSHRSLHVFSASPCRSLDWHLT